jgi:lipopolysaccharide/colanic/teichoic acid biosynthesis glycosyltransferase
MSLQTINSSGEASRLDISKPHATRAATKRAMDLLLASAMILVAAPVLAGIAVLLAVTGGPIFSCDARLGKGGRCFHCLRFRTGPSSIGRLLQQTALNELPQLFNVLRGDMSFVGPLPVTIDEFLTHYAGAAAQAYMSVRPGITGHWQINLRSNGVARRVELDCLYAHEHDLAGDLRLLLRTVALFASGRA